MLRANSSFGETEMSNAVTVYVSLIGIFGFVGNFLVILAFSQCRKLRTATNVFIVNLCGLSMVLSLFELLFSAPSAGAERWLYGHIGCAIHGALEFFFICVAMNTTAAISVDRYCVITKPIVGAKITFARAVYWTLGIYIYTLVFTVPTFFGWPGFHVMPFESGCYLRWHAHELSIIYASTIAVFLLALPYGIMIYCYWSIFQAVKRRKRNANTKTLPSPHTIRRDRKLPVNTRPHLRTARMIVLVMLVYSVVWGPCVISSLLRTLFPEVTFELLELTVLLARSNVLWTAVIYGILNERFRTVILTLLRCRTGSDWNTRDGRIFSTSFRDMSFFGHPRTISVTSSTSRKKSATDEPQSEDQKCIDVEALYKVCCCNCGKNNSYTPGTNLTPAAVITNLNYPVMPVALDDKHVANGTRAQSSFSTLTSPVELSVQSNGVQNKSNMKAEHLGGCAKNICDVRNPNRCKKVRLTVDQHKESKHYSSREGLENQPVSYLADIHVDACANEPQECVTPRARYSSSMGDITQIHRDNRHSRAKRRSGSFSMSVENSAQKKPRHTIEEVRQYWAHRNLLLDDVSWDHSVSDAENV